MAKYTKAFGLLCLVLPLLVSTLMATQIELVFSADASAEATENSWASKAPMKQARGGLGVAVVNGKIYAIGGSTFNGTYPPGHSGFVGTNEEYDPTTNTWTFKRPMPTPRDGFAIAVYQNKIYCIGGRTTENIPPVNEVYDPATDTWETKTARPPSSWMLQANVANGEIFLIGGGENESLNEVYDPKTDSWSMKTPLPTGVFGYCSAVVDGNIYVLGGFTAHQLKLTQIYDAAKDSWSLGLDLPETVFEVAAGATTGVLAPKRVYVFDGYAKVYDPAANKWAYCARMPTNRVRMGVGVVNDMLYVIGGFITYSAGLIERVSANAANEMYTPFGYGSALATPTPTSVSTPVPTSYDYTTPIPYTYSPTPSTSPAPTYYPPPITPTPTPTPTLTPTPNPTYTPTTTSTASPTPSPSPSPTQQPTFEPTQSANPTIPPNGVDYSYLIIGTVAVVVVVITIVGLAVYFKLGKKKIVN